MKKTLTLLTILLLVVFIVGCENSINPIQPQTQNSTERTSLAKAAKVDVCHLDEYGNYIIINISENAYDAHIAHGDKSAIWYVGGTWRVDIFLEGGPVTPWDETLILTQSGTDITGGSINLTIPNPGAAWTVIDAGSDVIGNSVNIMIDHDNSSLEAHFVGTVDSDGSMSGTWHDESPGTRTGTWNSTTGEATYGCEDLCEEFCDFLGEFAVHYYPSYGGDIPHTMTISVFDRAAGTFLGTGGPDSYPYDYDLTGTIVGDVVTLNIDYGDDDPIAGGRYTLQAVFTINEDCSFNRGEWSASSTSGYTEGGTMQVTTDATEDCGVPL